MKANGRHPGKLDFLAFRQHYDVPGDQIVPEPQDFDPGMIVETERDRAAAYRMARARKLNRLYQAWKAEQN